MFRSDRFVRGAMLITKSHKISHTCTMPTMACTTFLDSGPYQKLVGHAMCFCWALAWGGIMRARVYVEQINRNIWTGMCERVGVQQFKF